MVSPSASLLPRGQPAPSARILSEPKIARFFAFSRWRSPLVLPEPQSATRLTTRNGREVALSNEPILKKCGEMAEIAPRFFRQISIDPMKGCHRRGCRGAEWSRRDRGTLDDWQAHFVPLGQGSQSGFFLIFNRPQNWSLRAAFFYWVVCTFPNRHRSLRHWRDPMVMRGGGLRGSYAYLPNGQDWHVAISVR